MSIHKCINSPTKPGMMLTCIVFDRLQTQAKGEKFTEDVTSARDFA